MLKLLYKLMEWINCRRRGEGCRINVLYCSQAIEMIMMIEVARVPQY
jgi:hypothetical protein